MNGFAVFSFEGNGIALMNGHFDADNPGKVYIKGNIMNYSTA